MRVFTVRYSPPGSAALGGCRLSSDPLPTSGVHDKSGSSGSFLFHPWRFSAGYLIPLVRLFSSLLTSPRRPLRRLTTGLGLTCKCPCVASNHSEPASLSPLGRSQRHRPWVGGPVRILYISNPWFCSILYLFLICISVLYLSWIQIPPVQPGPNALQPPRVSLPACSHLHNTYSPLPRPRPLHFFTSAHLSSPQLTSQHGTAA